MPEWARYGLKELTWMHPTLRRGPMSSRCPPLLHGPPSHLLPHRLQHRTGDHQVAVHKLKHHKLRVSRVLGGSSAPHHSRRVSTVKHDAATPGLRDFMAQAINDLCKITRLPWSNCLLVFPYRFRIKLQKASTIGHTWQEVTHILLVKAGINVYNKLIKSQQIELQ